MQRGFSITSAEIRDLGLITEIDVDRHVHMEMDESFINERREMWKSRLNSMDKKDPRTPQVYIGLLGSLYVGCAVWWYENDIRDADFNKEIIVAAPYESTDLRAQFDERIERDVRRHLDSIGAADTVQVA